VREREFEPLLRFLARNGYSTLSADELQRCLVGAAPIPDRAVVLTFDDGWRSLYTVAYPLLRQYGLRAECFIVPGLIDALDGSPDAEGDGRDAHGPFPLAPHEPLCTWAEIRSMHASGVIGFESHSLYHHRVAVSPEVEDFWNPAFDPGPRNFNTPMYREGDRENVLRDLPLGTPIHQNAPRMSARRRYLDDVMLRETCVGLVARNGGMDFFGDKAWRVRLGKCVSDFRARYGDRGRFETGGELQRALLEDLAESKALIERNLPGKTVRHFCFPWWVGSERAVSLSMEAGYRANFWGVLPGRRTNRRGDDPYRVVRLLSEDYIFRLPGHHRRPLRSILKSRILNNYARLFGRLRSAC
jgi:peptidoglycan/xylan/chitin deacetylase (PgdA/CDA1 family)